LPKTSSVFHLDAARISDDHSAIDAEATAPLRIEHEERRGTGPV
jgi:hypothetical protein